MPGIIWLFMQARSGAITPELARALTKVMLWTWAITAAGFGLFTLWLFWG